MATRKRAKSIQDILNQVTGFLPAVWRARQNGDDAEADRIMRRYEQAVKIKDAYIDNISKSKTFQNEYLKKSGWRTRKYVDYNTDRAKAASNG